MTAGHPGRSARRKLALKVIAIYWPQTNPIAGRLTLPPDHNQDDRLRQNQSRQAEIVSRIVRFRRDTIHDATSPLSQARDKNPAAFERLERFVEWKLVEYARPGRLQLIGKSDEPFIYKLGWTTPIAQTVVQSDDFAGALVLMPDAGDHLLRMSTLLRPLIQRTWALTLARWNGLEDAKLDSFLFGFERGALAPVRPGLRELARNRCFYCDGHVDRADRPLHPLGRDTRTTGSRTSCTRTPSVTTPSARSSPPTVISTTWSPDWPIPCRLALSASWRATRTGRAIQR